MATHVPWTIYNVSIFLFAFFDKALCLRGSWLVSMVLFQICNATLPNSEATELSVC